MRPLVTLTGALFLTSLAGMPPAQPTASRPVGEILRSFVEDFRSDPAAAAKSLFGISISGVVEPEWHVVVNGRKDASGRFEVELRKGLPPTPAVVYTTDPTTLDKIDRGEMNALTAMGRARASDPAPMDITFMPGFQPDEDLLAVLLPLTFHFWTRGFPEAVAFNEAAGREVHGATMVVLYYQKGLRSAWGQIRKGQRVNADPRDQVNPFPTMIVGLRGRAMAKVGGVEKILEPGHMVFIPPGTAHEAWNPFDEPAEFIILMFGDGA
ncbi:MAG TPA: cupin domain-containing protein [Acidobacteriota bacterium]|nr:cupin domain-containing protein [Acidobacteriota bacterium]